MELEYFSKHRRFPRYEGGDIVTVDCRLPDCKPRYKVCRVERHASPEAVYLRILGEVGYSDEYMRDRWKSHEIITSISDCISSLVSRPRWPMFIDSVAYVNQALLMGQSCLDSIRKGASDYDIRLFARGAATYALTIIGGCESSKGTEWERTET